MSSVRLVIVTALTLGVPVAAAAQAARPARAPIGIVSAGVGVQGAPSSFSDTAQFPLYVETGRFTSDYAPKGGLVVDFGGAVRVWRALQVGVAVTRFSHDHAASIDGSLPHPFVFNRLRPIAGEQSGLDRTETGVHISARWSAAVARHVDVAVFGGPSWIGVRQDLVGEVRYDEEYPYDTAEFAGASLVSASKSAIGFHAGAEVLYRLTSRIGVGGLVRFSRATVDLPVGGRTVEVDAGGVQTSAGVRFWF